MKIKLINYTGKGLGERYAAELLIFTKSTRLNLNPVLMDEISKFSDEKIKEELEYMSETIPSSWEFVDYSFLIEECDRGFTHQLVRSRQGSYAQQTMRILNMESFEYNTGPTIKGNEKRESMYACAMDCIQDRYDELIEDGAKIEDARGVLPTNIQTNIIVKFNLRTMAELVQKRSSPRVQGAYREFLNGIVEEATIAHPWVKIFLENKKIKAATAIQDFIESSEIADEAKTNLYKMLDLLRK